MMIQYREDQNDAMKSTEVYVCTYVWLYDFYISENVYLQDDEFVLCRNALDVIIPMFLTLQFQAIQ